MRLFRGKNKTKKKQKKDELTQNMSPILLIDALFAIRFGYSRSLRDAKMHC